MQTEEILSKKLNAGASPEKKNATILVVDDQHVNQILMQKYVEIMGHSCLIAGTGEEAIEIVRTKNPDLIIMDVMMPGMNGFEATRIIKDNPDSSSIPVIIMTALDSTEDKLQGIESGADDFITKPFNELTLKARVKSLLRIGEYNKTIQKQYRRLQKELEMARILQHSILPNKKIKFRGLDISHKYLPCSELGGDFYSITSLDENKIGFFIADVLGHGVQASLVTMILKTLFDGQAVKTINPSEILKDINYNLYTLLNNSVSFATACYLIADVDRQTIHYSTAGHPPGFLIRKGNGEITEIKTRGSVIGAFGEMDLESCETQMNPGDTVFLYTDGLAEVFNDSEDEFGLHVLPDLLKESRNDTPEQIIENVLLNLKEFSGKDSYEDDINIICFQYNP